MDPFKEYFDRFRAEGKLPPQLENLVEGQLFDNFELLKKWRFWKTGPSYIDKELNVQLVSALDDCLVTDDNFFIPLDYKSKASIKEDSHVFHQNQLNLYTWLLDENGYPTKDVGYLVFFAPTDILDNSTIKFDIVPKRIETSKENAKKLFYEASMLLQGPLPLKHQACEFCAWAGMDIHDIL